MNNEQALRSARMYEQYFVPAIFSRWAPVLLKYARPVAGERVLDVACGTGAVARCVAPLVGDQGRVVAVDINPAMLAVARELPDAAGATVEWVEGSAVDLPDASFELVLCQQGLQFFPDRESAAREMRDALEPDGRVALSVWCGLDRHPVYDALFNAEARHLDVPLEMVSTPFSFGDEDDLSSLLLSAGFDSAEVATESHTVAFPSPKNFVRLTALAGAAVIPELAKMDDEAREELVRDVGGRVAPTLEKYIAGDEVTFTMHSYIAVAQA